MITEKQAEKRKKYLGSSDAAAVCGLDNYRSPIDVYYDKADQIEATGRNHSNDAIEVGTWCEDAVLRWFSEKKGLNIVRNQFRVHENGIMAANMDALVQDDPTQAIEAKTTAVVSRYVGEEWGEIETDQVPERIKLQCLHQMAVVPTLQIVWVPVLMGGVGFRFYRIERDVQIIRELERIETEFWHNHVEKRIAPAGLPGIETLKKLARVPGKSVQIDDAIVGLWLYAKEQAATAEKIKKEAEQTLLATLGDAEMGTSGLGTLNYRSIDRKGYTVEPSKYRQLTFKKAKE